MPHILVVDDEVGMREGCRRALLRQGYEVSTAEHAAEALRMLRDQPVDLVLLDAMMPGMSGLEFLDRALERKPDIICVMITGYATVDLAAQAMKKGAQGFLPKPFTSDDLLTAVRGGLAEQERRQAARREKEQEEEALQLERTRQEQARLDAVTSRFLLVVIHELRNPAGAIKNTLQALLGGYVEQGEWQETLERLDGRAGQLLSMLDDLLDLAHLKEISSPGKLVPVQVADVLEQVVRNAARAAEAKGLRLVLDLKARPTVMAQPGHLRTLWRHLVDNAVYYTQQGEIRISLAEEAGWITSTVADTGIGLTNEEITRVFQEFYRTESAKAQAPIGTGLGLTIANQIVKLYQGSIQVESTPGEGSSFSVRLPVTPPGEQAP